MSFSFTLSLRLQGHISILLQIEHKQFSYTARSLARPCYLQTSPDLSYTNLRLCVYISIFNDVFQLSLNGLWNGSLVVSNRKFMHSLLFSFLGPDLYGKCRCSEATLQTNQQP